MDITQLRYFLKTAELLNYTRASEALFITRQSLRQAIGAIESEIGKPLFINTRNKLSLTEYGAYLAVSAAEVVSAFDRMNDGLGRMIRHQTSLRVAFSVSLFPFILPDTEVILRAFRAQFPAIRLDVRQMDNDEVILAAERGEIDCGCVIQMPCKRESCAMKPLTRFDAAVDFSDHSPLYGKHEVTLEDLRGLPCIGMGSLEKTLVPLWEDCRGKGISLDYQPISSTVDAFYQIQHGLAVGFDILKTEVPDYDPSRCARLTGYAFEIGFLCADRCTDTSALEVFCTFFARECTDRWNKLREEWNVQAKP